MATVKLSDLSDALLTVSSDYLAEAYVSRETGDVYWVGGEVEYGLGETQVPDDLDDAEKYIPVPDKRDLDLGTQLVFDFVERHLPNHYDDVRAMFRRKGAYGRLKDFLDQHEKLEQWYEFCDAEEKRVLLAWCRENALEVEDEATG